ncbi:hypothetical protein ACQWFV_24695, partial [Salmonella enterica subsp. enterica serovar Infantis]
HYLFLTGGGVSLGRGEGFFHSWVKVLVVRFTVVRGVYSITVFLFVILNLGLNLKIVFFHMGEGGVTGVNNFTGINFVFCHPAVGWRA